MTTPPSIRGDAKQSEMTEQQYRTNAVIKQGNGGARD